MTTVLPFARTVSLGERPENKHLVALHDEQQAAAARAAVPVKPWTPAAPKPEPEAVARRRADAAKLKQEAEQATANATAADEEATQLKHLILTAEGDVSRMELRLSKLEAQDFAKQAADARAAIKGGIENCDLAGSAPAFDRATLLILRVSEFQKIHAEAIRETKAALAAARERLAKLNDTK